MQKIITLVIALTLLPTLPAIAADWKKDGTTLWRSGYTPGLSFSVTYNQIPKTKSLKADKCGVIRVPGKKVSGAYYSPDGPIVVGNTNHNNIDATAGIYAYKCKANAAKVYVPQFVNASTLVFHHSPLDGEADYKGNIYVGGSGVSAGNSYSVEWFSFKQRKAKANSCGIVVLKSNSTTDHGSIGKIDGNNISSLVSGITPKCKSGVIVP